ncbi:MAG: TlpA family protein disulfide reductase [Xanthomonadales bacterium]|nr:TlpA family protein disulfide reductase [Xanthomonadales bacterium]
MIRKTLLALGMGASLALAGVGSAWAQEADSAPVDFTLEQFEGDKISLSDYRGQWVVVNYWATWCAPCRKEIPDLSELHQDRSDVTVLGLAYEEVEAEAFSAFLDEHPASYPILLVDVFEPPAVLGSPRVLPTTYIVDPSGSIAKTFYGPIKSTDITEFISAQG